MLQQVLTDTATNAVSLGLVNMVENVVPPASTPTMQYLRRGLLWGLADELVDFYATGESSLAKKDVWSFTDKVGFNSVVNYAIDSSDIANLLYTSVFSNSPLPDRVNLLLLSGSLKTGASVLSSVIDRQYSDTPLKFLIHPTAPLRERVAGF